MSEVVVLFGASGFVGRNVLNRLTAEGRTVYAVTGSGAPMPQAASTVSLDRAAELPSLPADAVAIHVAAYRYDSERFELKQSDILVNNLALNSRVFQFCAERGVKELRMASSVAVYPDHLAVMDDAEPLDLNTPPYAGEAFYAWSKRVAEVMADLYARQYGVHTISFRLSNPYGPHDCTDPRKAHVAPAFVMKALDANPVFPIRGDPSVERDFVYVGDVVEAFVRSFAWRGRTEAFNLCTGQTVTLQTLAETCLRLSGASKPIESGAPGAFGPAKRVSTNARIRAAIGLAFRGLDEGLDSTIHWYRNHLHG